MSSTIKEIGEILNLSVATVSYALNDKPGVSTKTKQRVREMARKLDYRPHELARSLVLQRTKVIGLILFTEVTALYAEIISAVEHEARQQNYSVLLTVARNDEEKREAISLFRSHHVEGLLIGPVFYQSELAAVRDLLESPLPCVLFGCLEPSRMSYVSTDRSQGVHMAVNYLLSLGHKRIAYVSLSRVNESLTTKLQGYITALSEAGIPLSKELIWESASTLKDGHAGMRKLLALPEPPTAVFCHNDLVAMGAYRAIREAGLKIPGDISVIGFDNIEEGDYLDPPLTTVEQPKEEFRRKLVDVLMERIHAPESPAHRVVLESRLVMKDSCARAKKK